MCYSVVTPTTERNKANMAREPGCKLDQASFTYKGGLRELPVRDPDTPDLSSVRVHDIFMSYLVRRIDVENSTTKYLGAWYETSEHRDKDR